MASQRKFYHTKITVEILSEEPYTGNELADVAHDIIWGGCSGQITNISSETINGKQCADLLLQQASEPSFFQLDDEGNDVSYTGEDEEASDDN